MPAHQAGGRWTRNPRWTLRLRGVVVVGLVPRVPNCCPFEVRTREAASVQAVDASLAAAAPGRPSPPPGLEIEHPGHPFAPESRALRHEVSVAFRRDRWSLPR